MSGGRGEPPASLFFPTFIVWGQVRVVDNGVGISKEAQQQLFKPYVQLRAGELQGVCGAEFMPS